MKKILIYFHLMFLTIAANATGQDGDIIYVDGARWELLGRPVCRDSLLYHQLKAVLPSERSCPTSNWDGFTSYWSIVQDKLCLDSIRCEHYDINSHRYVGERIPNDTLLRVFKNHVCQERIVAGWMTGDIRIATGKVISYEHMGFARNYEREQIISLNKGKVIGKKDYHNFVVDGFAFDKVKDNAEIRKLFPLQIEKYPELSGVKRILFSIGQARVDSLGNLVECEVKVLKPDVGPQLAEEMTRLLKAYRSWKVSFINGEYRADGIAHWTFPYLIANDEIQL